MPEQATEIRDIERFIGQKVPQAQARGFQLRRATAIRQWVFKAPRPVTIPGPAHGQHAGHGQRQPQQRRAAPDIRRTAPDIRRTRTHPAATAPAAPAAPQQRPPSLSIISKPGQPERAPGGGQPAPRKFGGLSRGSWTRRG